MAHRPHVLIVEDPEEPSGAMALRLSDSEFRVGTCALPKVALEFVLERRPDLVLMQASFLYREGVENLGAWRQVPEDSRLLFVDCQGSWTTLLELPDPETGTVRIFPCPTAQISEILKGMRPGGIGVPAA
jgi:DNA-binding NtrC family response regulator